MKVANKKCVRRLALRNMKQSKTRNIVAVIAVILTTVLFTSLFTISMSIIDGFQDANFRQMGSKSHGAFERLYESQYEELKSDSDIRESGVRMLVGIAEDAPFNKAKVEVSYCDSVCAEYMYLTPEVGSLPAEGTNEAATDTRILSLLGIEPVIGSEFELTFCVNDEPVTRVFTLSGYWEADDLAPADHILLSKSMADEICKNFQPDVKEGKSAGLYDLYYMLEGSSHLDEKTEEILAKYGYQSKDPKADNYIKNGVNIGYVAALFSSSDMETLFLIMAILLLIMFTGYLVIHNIFRIAIANDIRGYGLLKTIGTTQKQIRRMVYTESLIVSMIAIPIGLLLGYGIGNLVTPVVIEQLNDISVLISSSPFIFVFASVFSLITVLISSLKPAKIASRVSPIEALRYTDGENVSTSKKRYRRNVSIFKMAVSNVGRNKAKTVITMLSLTLAVLLLNITFSVTNSFDMDKYLRDVKADFMIGHANYFRASGHLFSAETSLPESVIKEINDTGLVTEAGVTYGIGSEQVVYQYVPKETYVSDLSGENADVDYLLEHEEQVDGRYRNFVDLYGMDDFCLNQLDLIDGDISKLNGEDNYIVAVYRTDEYGNVEKDTNWASVGDYVTIRYVEEYEWYNPDTGQVYSEEELEFLSEDEECSAREVKYHDVNYKVCATVTVSEKMGYRYYIFNQFVLSSQNLKSNLSNVNAMYYAYNVADEHEDIMEQFISDYTEKVMTEYDYESRQLLEEDLDSYKQMFLLLGGILSIVIGLIGVLNFLNVMLTNIVIRKREFAMLQSIGMTGKQLTQMLVTEGLIYALGSILWAVLALLLTKSVLKEAVENLLWFCTYQTNLKPILFVFPLFVLLGVIIPIWMYRILVKKSIVERLREGE